MIPETVTPAGLRERAKIMRDILDESCARHLELAANEIERLRTFDFAQCSRVQEAQALADCAEGCLNCRNSAYPSDVLRECIKFLRGTCANSSTSRNSEPWDAHYNRSYEPVETRAKEIYDFFEYRDVGTKPAWVTGGNSLMQDEARICARKQLRDASHTPSVTSPLRQGDSK